MSLLSLSRNVLPLQVKEGVSRKSGCSALPVDWGLAAPSSSCEQSKCALPSFPDPCQTLPTVQMDSSKDLLQHFPFLGQTKAIRPAFKCVCSGRYNQCNRKIRLVVIWGFFQSSGGEGRLCPPTFKLCIWVSDLVTASGHSILKSRCGEWI